MIWHRRVHGKWHDLYVNVEEVRWHELSPGDMVFIAGDLVGGTPTAMYGRHKVIDPKKNILENYSGKQFYENFDYVFKEK